ncbi:uncharacterized protein LOC126842323 [Adelges cooleyi]|uniref:uncharacterized protein LOC126841608 n=1 Tax=Adelges cooleyi TaxID=133065 RepID=UPI0021800426|nr:uncharacterized protein LOC126841608 [Adelges cooleyi]XP_050435207.1 uncharacterized protein LOC126842323 [Adelges cooleyi]
MSEYLNVLEKHQHDDSIKREYYLEHQSFNNSYENNDEIRIEVRNKEKFTVPCESYLQIEGSLEKPEGASGEMILTQNGLMHLFDEIRYEINGKEIDKVKNVGVVTTIKGYCSFTPSDIARLQPAGWKHVKDNQTSRDLMDKTEFVAQYPLSACMGFFERFRRVLINCTQSLVLIRSSRDIGAIECVTPEESKKAEGLAEANVALLKQTAVKITKIKWIVKYFDPNVKTELSLMRILDGKRWLPLDYQQWDIAVYPLVPQTTHHTWSVRTFSNVEKPRYLLIAMGKERSIMSKSDFHHCTLRNVKAYLNSDEYPYENYNADFEAGKYTSMYNSYARFQTMYYGRTNPQPLLDRVHYKKLGPIIVIDCSKQNDTVKSSTVDLRLDFECAKAFPQNTSLYCVIIHDCQMEYNAFSGEVRKL